MATSYVPALPESVPATVGSPHHHVVESFHVKDGKHLRDVRLDFADGLNVIIGARGSGKTTLVQNLRYSVGTSATGPRASRNDDLVMGTLGSGHLVTRVRTRHGVQYVASRNAMDPTRVTDADGVHRPVSLDSELFRIEVYSQKEIESMAENPAAQLALVDKFAEAEIRDHHDAIGRVERQLTLNGAALTRLEADIDELGARTRDLPTVTAALLSLTDATGPDADAVRHARDARLTRGRESAVVSGALQELRTILQRLDAFDLEAKRRLGVELPAGLDQSANRALVERVESTLRLARAAVARALTQARATLVDVETGLDAAVAALGLAHAGQTAIDEQLTRQHDADAGRAADRERLQRRFLELEQFEKRLGERRREHEALSAQRQEMRVERARLVSARFAVRTRVGEELTRDLQGDIRVSVQRTADREAYVALLGEMVKGAHLRTELVREIARQIRPEDLVELVLMDDPAPLQAVDDARTGKAERAQRFLNALRASGRLFELDTVSVPDVPLLELKIGERYQPSDKVSAGQSCTAVLPILLLQSASPLLIDEPEHCLDNSFIYDVLVVSLMRVKKARQLIFVTHNPNIPVLAEAERVFVMDETDGVGRLLEHGTVDAVRGSIERLLEGGREAFLRRSVRYGHRLDAGGAS